MATGSKGPERQGGGFGVQFLLSFRPDGKLEKISFAGWGRWTLVGAGAAVVAGGFLGRLLLG